MDVQEILSQLERDERRLPRVALEEAAVHREEIIPRLLGVLQDVARDPELYATDKGRTIHIYAMYLLAEFREPRAYPLLVKIFSAPGEVPFELVGDVVTEDLASLLASVSDGDPSGMKALVENEHVNEWVRGVALDGLITLVACGKLSRDEAIAYFRSLFHTLERKPGAVWDGLANVCADLWPAEVMADLRQAYEDGLVDTRHIAWEDVTEALGRGQKAALKEVQRRYRLTTNVVDEIKWWAYYKKDENDTEGPDEDEKESAGVEEELDDYTDIFPPQPWSDPDVPEPLRRTQPKVGRNEPCPCGSGKKSKKCCGRPGASAGLS